MQGELDLDVCKDVKINMNIQVSINEDELFKHNPSSSYYNDICCAYTTDDNTDILIEDRKNEFNDEYLSLCENNCTYKGYNSQAKKASCECQAKNDISLISEIANNQDKLLSKFTDIKKTLNIEIIKCYHLLLDVGGLKSNIGSCFLLSILFVEFTLSIAFIVKGYKSFINYISKNIIKIEDIRNNISIREEKDKKRKYKNKNKNGKPSININIINSRQCIINRSFSSNKIKGGNNPPNKNNNNLNNFASPINKSHRSHKTDKKNKTHQNNKGSKIHKKYKSDEIYKNNRNKKSYKNYKIPELDKLGKTLKEKNNIKGKKIIEGKKYINYNDYELNNLPYQEALKIDKRDYIPYYISLLKYNQLLIFTFYTYNDYNSKIIKICLFLLLLSLYYTVNALFYNSDTLHQIYVNKGKYDFLYNILKIIYSSFISTITKIIGSYFSLTEKNIMNLKQKTDKKSQEITKFLRCIKIKFILFYLVAFLFLTIFWYYLACFCAVYKNSQVHVIKDASVSFVISLLYPFGLSLLPGIFRQIALRDKKGGKECIYKFSKFLQLL